MIKFTKYVKVSSLEEAYELNKSRANVIMGGMMWLGMQNRNIGTAVDISGLGLDRIEENDESYIIGAMVPLRSLECHAGVVFISTVFFYVVGIDNWKILAIIWAVIPIGNAFVFSKVPIAPLLEDGDTGLGLKKLFRMKIFWILLIMMICAGASEQAVSQWASAFAEKGLGISKAAGDLAGPMAFAVLMGISRLFYGKYGDRINLEHFMIYSSFLCILSYLGISLFSIPLLNLIACAVCGLSVGIMWPGTFSKASAALPKGGTAMFALLALGGDIGCSGGPTLVGMVSGAFGDNLKMGILAGIIFPALLLIGVILCRRQKKIINYNTVKSRH